FDENCQFCCLRRDKVKVRFFFLPSLFGMVPNRNVNISFSSIKIRFAVSLAWLMITSQRRTPHTPKKQFFFCVFSDVPNFSDPHIPVVAREILQRMISQFAAEYTSKTSSPQASRSHSPPHSDQMLSQLLMAAQDAPLDLTIKKPAAEPHQQGNGVLDLSIKKNRNSSSSISANSLCLSPAVSTLKCITVHLHSCSAARARVHASNNKPSKLIKYKSEVYFVLMLETGQFSPTTLSYRQRRIALPLRRELC
uniref:Ligand-dependent corepressor-like n=1 Tax=Fundulus heteroclitus TaxID=8078 RepID=A0A3Q2NRI2_FUNHE